MKTDILDQSGGRITATSPAWEFLYDYVEQLTRRRIGVIINGELELQLEAIEGTFDETGWLAGSAWNEEESDWTGASVTLDLFEKDGTPNIDWIHIL